MVIEVHREYVLVDGKDLDLSEVFTHMRGYDYEGKKPTLLDFRKNIELQEEPDIIIINISGRNLEIIGVNDWHVTLKTSQGIIAREGYMEYMSQYDTK